MGKPPGFEGIFEITSIKDSSGSLSRLKSVLLIPCLQKIVRVHISWRIVHQIASISTTEEVILAIILLSLEVGPGGEVPKA